MRVFIIWSGDESRAYAKALRDWLPSVIQAVRPFYSDDDVRKGSMWANEVVTVLDDCRVGLICVTPTNLDAAWPAFEAGAVRKAIGQSRVVPLLFGVKPTDISGPLQMFQAASFSHLEIFQVLQMMNAELQEPLQSDTLRSTFELWWPKLERSVGEIEKQQRAPKEMLRTDRQLLEEILLAVRAGMTQVNPKRNSIGPEEARRLLGVIDKVEKEIYNLAPEPPKSLLHEMGEIKSALRKVGGPTKKYILISG